MTILADRVFETSTTTGTGTLSLAGAQTGFQTFVAGIGNSNGYAPPVNAIWSMLAGVVFYFRKKKYFNEVAAEAKKLLLAAVFGQAAAAEGENDES